MKKESFNLSTSIIFIASIFIFIISCNEDRIGQNPIDDIAPTSVTNVQITALPGGAKISMICRTKPIYHMLCGIYV